MRIAIFTIDSLASNAAVRTFLSRHTDKVVLLGLSPPFRRSRGGFLLQTWRHFAESGASFSIFLGYNFVVPRCIAPFSPHAATLEGVCKTAGIATMRVDDVNGPDVARKLDELGVDLIVSCHFDQIFRKEIIERPRHGVLNLHTSALPAHRGPMPAMHCCLDDPVRFGVTLHCVEEGIDSGPILAQACIEPAPRRSLLGVMADLHARGLDLLDEVLADLEAARRNARPQSGGSYESFPDRRVIRALHARGFRLVDGADMARSFTTPMSI